MYDYYFTFRSMTQAQRAVSALRQAGIFAALIRTPRPFLPRAADIPSRWAAMWYTEPPRFSVPI